MGKEVSFMNGSKGDIKTILQGLKELDALVKGQTMESFKCDTQKQKAVSYTLIILSRNAAKCCDEFMDISMPQVPLRNLAGVQAGFNALCEAATMIICSQQIIMVIQLLLDF